MIGGGGAGSDEAFANSADDIHIVRGAGFSCMRSKHSHCIDVYVYRVLCSACDDDAHAPVCSAHGMCDYPCMSSCLCSIPIACAVRHELFYAADEYGEDD